MDDVLPQCRVCSAGALTQSAAAATCDEHIEKQSRAFEESSSISATLKPLQEQEEISSLAASVLALAAPCTDSSHAHC